MAISGEILEDIVRPEMRTKFEEKRKNGWLGTNGADALPVCLNLNVKAGE